MIHGPFRQPAVKIVGTRRSSLDLARGRMVVLSVFFMLAWLLVTVRVFDLTVIQGAMARAGGDGGGIDRKAAFDPESVPVPEKKLRADILDRNGVLLATSLRTASLYVDQLLVRDPAVLARGLHAVFPDTTVKTFESRLKGRKRFAWVRRNLTPEEQYKILELGEPGLDFQEEPRRIYPQGSLAAHIVGYGDVDGSGLSGVERAFDKQLESGGEAVRLSLDVRIQHALRREILSAMKDFTAKGGAGVVLDVRSGEILAAVSLPDFDPHLPAKAPDDQKRNRVTLDVLELGSMFKIFSTAAVLEIKNVSMGQTFDATQSIQRHGFTISDYHPERRFLSVPEVFMHSSNIGAALMGEMVGTEALRAFYGQLGLTSKMDLEIAETGAPLLPDPWRDINTLTASYGHGIAVSPMQLAAATSALLGSGVYAPPTLLAAGDSSKKAKGLRVVSPGTVKKMRALMRLVVTDGTGTNAEVPGYRVGGKTGTAEMSVSGRYDTSRLISSFVGAFPSDDPRYVVLVVVEEPKPNEHSHGYATGGWVAAPAAGRVIASMGAVLGLDVALKSPGRDPAESLRRYLHEKPKAPVLTPVLSGGAVPALIRGEAHLAAN